MRKLNLPFAMLLVASFTLLSSCKKDKYGNTDINHSTTTTLNNWTAEFLDAFNFTYSSTASWDKITQDVVDNGVILVYGNVEGEWKALPFSTGGTSPTQTDMYYHYSFSYSYSVGKVKVIFDGFDDSGSPAESDIPDLQVRIVTLSTHQVTTHPNVNLQDYDEVKEVFDL